MTPLLWAVVLVAVQRLLELRWSARNEARMRERGAVEHVPEQHAWFVLLHTSWLVGLPVILPHDAPVHPLPLGLYVLLQPIRVWCIASLGDRWSTRVLVPPGGEVRRVGPYRWMRHPNYAVASAEILLLPLAFGAVRWALLFSVLNAALVLWRVRAEEAALGLSEPPVRSASRRL